MANMGAMYAMRSYSNISQRALEAEEVGFEGASQFSPHQLQRAADRRGPSLRAMLAYMLWFARRQGPWGSSERHSALEAEC